MESGVTCGSHAWLMCSILLDLPLPVICICIKCPNSFKISLHSNFPNNLFHMKSHISCSLHVNCARYTVCCWIVMHKMNRKYPEYRSSSLLTTAVERNKLLTGCYFFACVVFSPQGMNAFVTDLIADNIVTRMEGFSSGILIIFFEKLCVKCEGIWITVWLPYTVNVQHSVWES